MSPKSADSENHFELTIVDTGDPSRVIVIARNGYDLAIERLSCIKIKQLAQFREMLVAASVGGWGPTEQELFEFGQNLFEFIAQLAIHKIYTRLPDKHTSLQIYSDRPDLQALPWEFIQQPGGKGGPNALRSVVRIVPTIGIDCRPPLKLGKTVRMLFVHAEPINQSSVEWEEMKSTIEREFNSRFDNLPK